jgi:hypothetical protein
MSIAVISFDRSLTIRYNKEKGGVGNERTNKGLSTKY